MCTPVYEVLNDTLKEASPDVIVTQNLCEVCAVALPDVEAAVCDWVGTDIDIVSLNAESISAVYDDIRRVAVSLNAVNTGAEVVERMQSRFTEVAERAADLDERPRVACIEWADPLMAAGNWIPEFVEAAGAENLFGSAGQHSHWLDWQALLDADPDVIILMPCGYGLGRTREEADLLSRNPRWGDLRAAREGRSYITDGNSFFNRPGRRSHRLHQHPAFGGGGSGGRGHSSTRLFQPNGCPVRPSGSGEADQAPRNRIRDIANC